MAHSGNRHQLEVDFFGGEPLMNYDVVHDLVLYARELEKKHDKHFQLTITTNALGLTDERIEFLNREMHNIVLSIDGRREVHDYMRPMVNGKGSFDEAVKRAKKLVNPARRRAVLRARHLHRPQPRLWQRRAGAGRRGL